MTLGSYEEFLFLERNSSWNPNDPCFEWKGPSFGGFKPQNRGQTGSRLVLQSKMLDVIPVLIHTVST